MYVLCIMLCTEKRERWVKARVASPSHYSARPLTPKSELFVQLDLHTMGVFVHYANIPWLCSTLKFKMLSLEATVCNKQWPQFWEAQLSSLRCNITRDAQICTHQGQILGLQVFVVAFIYVHRGVQEGDMKMHEELIPNKTLWICCMSCYSEFCVHVNDSQPCSTGYTICVRSPANKNHKILCVLPLHKKKKTKTKKTH